MVIMALWPSLVVGRLVMKSIENDAIRFWGMGSGCNRPGGLVVASLVL